VKKLHSALSKANEEKRRLVVPLLGFPGLQLTNSTIKLAQQNYGEHYKVLKEIADTFKPDAIFPLMDLSVEANAIGRYTLFPKEEFAKKDLDTIKNINIAYDTRLIGYVETIKLMREELPANILRGAYVTGPYTLAGLLLSADEAALATKVNTDYLHEICGIVTKIIQDYVSLLINAGAVIICILEPSAVMLGPQQFVEFSGNYVKSLCSEYKNTDVSFIYHICGNTNHIIKHMAQSGVDALSLDSPEAGIDLFEIMQNVKEDMIIIGNISPIGKMLFGTRSSVETEVKNLLNKMTGFPNFILSTGCDLPQETPLENIHAFMNTGRNYRMM